MTDTPQADATAQDVAALIARLRAEAEMFPGTFHGYDYCGQTLRMAADALAALTAEVTTLRSAMAADAERLRAAERRVYGDDTTFGCDGADHLAERVLALTAEVARVTAESEGRRTVLFEKAEELRAEWIRAENAEATVSNLRESAFNLERRLEAQRDAQVSEAFTLGYNTGHEHGRRGLTRQELPIVRASYLATRPAATPREGTDHASEGK